MKPAASDHMNEAFMAYLWQYHYCGTYHTTVKGCKVAIVDYGRNNYDAGPDIFNAKIYIDNTLWAGNVEFHVRSSDWMRHGHHTDARYDSVILHVVEQADCAILRTNGTTIPQIEITPPPAVREQYRQLQQSTLPLPCATLMHKYDSERFFIYLEHLIMERLEQRMERIKQLMTLPGISWQEAFYIYLARQYGGSVNADAFEQLALSLPSKILAKHRDHPHQLEALLYGQAGLLTDPADPYAATLAKEYQFLKHKYNLTPLPATRLKWMRMRPGSFPTVRLAHLAALIQHSHALFSKILEERSEKELIQLFTTTLSPYWQTHYNFGKTSTRPITKLSKRSIELILINVVAPFRFAYGHLRDIEKHTTQAIKLLHHLPPEYNSEIAPFLQLGIICDDAAHTQALLQLRRNYCHKKNCLQCRIGHRILATTKTTYKS